jgi:hypothetical protein
MRAAECPNFFAESLSPVVTGIPSALSWIPWTDDAVANQGSSLPAEAFFYLAKTRESVGHLVAEAPFLHIRERPDNSGLA